MTQCMVIIHKRISFYGLSPQQDQPNIEHDTLKRLLEERMDE